MLERLMPERLMFERLVPERLRLALERPAPLVSARRIPERLAEAPGTSRAPASELPQPLQ